VTKTFLMATIRVVIGLLVWPFAAHAHNHSRPELDSWFESLAPDVHDRCRRAYPAFFRSPRRTRTKVAENLLCFDAEASRAPHHQFVVNPQPDGYDTLDNRRVRAVYGDS